MTIRIAIAALAIVAAALTYPWQTTADYWTVGVAAALLIVVLAWWRGLFVTNMIGRRFAILRRNNSKRKARRGSRVTQLLRVDDPHGVGLPPALIAAYVERFGIRCRHVRITSHQAAGGRTTWVGLTIDARDNLAALQARSADMPLIDTAEVVGRRLADQLRETGLDVSGVDDSPAPLINGGRERWASVRDDSGSITGYAVHCDAQLPARLAELAALPGEVWTAVEFAGTGARPTVAAACAIRTGETVKGVPLAGLSIERGRQRPLLTALDPKSVDSLGVPAVPAGSVPVAELGEHEVPQEAGHPA